MNFEFEDTPKYRKKKAKKVPKKSDHKHEYTIPIAVKWEFMKGKYSYSFGHKCSICGKISYDNSWIDFKNKKYYHSDEEVRADYPEIEIIKGDPFTINKD